MHLISCNRCTVEWQLLSAFELFDANDLSDCLCFPWQLVVRKRLSVCLVNSCVVLCRVVSHSNVVVAK